MVGAFGLEHNVGVEAAISSSTQRMVGNVTLDAGFAKWWVLSFDRIKTNGL